MAEKTGVLFVCLGNICRSPTAHAVFETLVGKAGLQHLLTIDSCGTGSWHIGQPPDDRMQKAALKRGYDMSHLLARRLEDDDFQRFDYILAMDTRNLADVMKKAPREYNGNIQLLMDYSPDKTVLEVPDPYYGDQDGFDRVLHLVESACNGLLQRIRKNDA